MEQETISQSQPHRPTDTNSSNRQKDDQITEALPETHDAETGSTADSAQAGVQRAAILQKTWSKKGMIITFMGLFLYTLATHFGDYSSQVYIPYTTSSFKSHSSMSAARVASNIASITAYPIIAKLGDVFGRGEMFTFSILITTLCYVIYAACTNISQYAVAAVFHSVGSTGFGLTQQVFIADVTNLINRGLWSTLPDSISTIPTLYLGTTIGQSVLDHSTWRWGWAMWAIVLPVCGLPLLGSVFFHQHQATKNGLGKKRLAAQLGLNASQPWWKQAYELLWVQLDLPGALLLLAGLALTLIPISLTGANRSDRWQNATFIALLVVGIVLLVLFALWDIFVAKKPFVPYRMIKSKTVAAACLLGALDFLHYSMFTVFYSSYLQVVGGYSPGHATRIDNALRVSFQASGIFAGLFMKYTKRSQIWVLIGAPLCVLGMGILLYLIDMGDGKMGNEASFVTAKALIGIGRGFYQTASQVSAQAVVTKQELSVVTAVFFASMGVGGAIGTSISGAIWRNNLPTKLRKYLPEELKPQAMAIFQSIVTAKKYAKGTPAREAIDRSYRETQRLLAIGGLCAVSPMLIVMFFLKNVHLDKRDNVVGDAEERLDKVEGESGKQVS
ncbi:major facilitator superfamily domain-containing protein [Aspergillus novoparasiticus]|uniref:Major facilitator superfamily domain-containing protein n=1 Tax=Aspergillus novoparasiticus TaxID=986946 RepID=A0A5N6F7J4_9EURO|nr:major facilitator superfamily domain-containing protein [Aspergillus novoparasiticus]